MLQFLNGLLSQAWKCLLDGVRHAKSPAWRPTRRTARFIEELEIRITPAIGAFDIPGPIQAGEGYDGVARFNVASGALLSTARHFLTAAHTGSAGSTAAPMFTVLGMDDAVNISTPGAGFIQHPNYLIGPASDYDIGVQPLAELAPLTAERWELYTDDDEVNRVGTLVGYGGTGTGTIGHSTDVNPGEYWNTSTGQDTNYEVIRLTITGNPTGGYFTVQIGDDPAIQNVPFDTTAATLTNRLNALPNISQVLVRMVGDIDFDGVIENVENPYQGSFEVLFRGTTADDHSMPDISVTNHLVSGNIVLEKLLDGGSQRIKTGGRNQIADVSPDGFRLYADFDDGTPEADVFGDGLGQGAAEAYGTWGDSGSPLFIDGKIAGVLEGLYNETPQGVDARGFDDLGGSGDFGQIDSWARVSAHLDFLNNILDDPFDLVLNMETQPWGDDDDADNIAFSRVANSLRIHIDGVLRYTEDIDLIQSVTIRGSSDDESILVGALGSIPVLVYGNGGNDTLRASSVSTGATVLLSGGSGDDDFYVGDGDLDSDIRGELFIFGESGEDSLLLDDTQDNNQFANIPDIYNFSAIAFHKPNPWSASVTFTNALETIQLDANPDDNIVNIDATVLGRTLTVFTGSGDDEIFVGAGDISANLDGALVVHGGFGNDSLVIDDSSGGPVGDHTLNVDSYTKSTAAGNITFQFIQNIRLETGSFGDVVNVMGTSEDFDLTLNTNGGNDTIRVFETHESTGTSINAGLGSDTITIANGNIDAIGGSLVIRGGFANDTLYINDQDDIGNDNFIVSANQVVKTDFSLFYDRIESLTLNTGFGDNTININNTLPTTQVLIFAGAGLDTIHLSPLSQQLGQIQGLVTVNGQSGNDTVVVHDELFAQGAFNPYSLMRTTLNRTGFGGLIFETIERLDLNMGSGSDTVNVQEFNHDTVFALYGNNGADTFNVSVNPLTSINGGGLLISGGSPLNQLNADRIKVIYTTKPDVPKKPKIHHTKDSPVDGVGMISVEYPEALFSIEYEGIEKVDIDKQVG